MSATLEIDVGFSTTGLTVDIFPDGSDTADVTTGSITEATNRKGIYLYTATGLSGLKRVIPKTGSTPLGTFYAQLATSGTVVCEVSRAACLALPVTPVATQTSLDAVSVAVTSISNRVPSSLTGDGNIKADTLKINGDAPSIPSESDVATAVWAAGTRTLSSFGTLVADVAAAVWAAASRTLTAFGFTVAATVDEESIAAATATQVISGLAGVEITVTSAIVGAGEIRIKQGDDYDADIGTAITWTITGLASFVGGSAAFTGGGITGKACTVVSATVIRMELTAAETAEGTLERTKGSEYKLVITFANTMKRSLDGIMVVTNQYGILDDPE